MSFFAIYFIWGSTYLFVAFAVEEIPPFILASCRFFVASALVLSFILLTSGFKNITRQQLINSAIAGVLFLGIGNGGMSYALQYIDSGYACLLTAAQPLFLLLMMWALDRKPLNIKAWLGVFIGMIGMYLLVGQDTIVLSKMEWVGTAVIMGCLISWGIGSLYVNRRPMPPSYLLNTGIQMLSGGMFLIFVSYLVQEPSTSWTSLKPITWISLSVLVIFGSIIAFTAFNFLLKHVSPEKVSTATYINPMVALALGYYFRDEIITLQTIIAAIVLFIGVYFISTNKPK